MNNLSLVQESPNDILHVIPKSVGTKIKAFGHIHVERGIFPSEMAAVVGIVEHVGATRIIESGRWLGSSTELLCRYFKDSNVWIDSIDYWRNDIAVECEKRLAEFKNLSLEYGDAFKLLPKMIHESNEPTVVLIDGPKGAVAVGLIQKILSAFPHVHAVLLHDSCLCSEARDEIVRRNLNAVYTDDADFVRQFAFLDEGIQTVYPGKCSGTLDTLGVMSYGATLACIFPRHNETRQPVFGSPLRMQVRFIQGKLEAWVRRVLYLLKHAFLSILRLKKSR